ncbi:MAG: cytochrome d ubiquinol oxidase subunit II [Desulfovibrio sp.]|nr:cytochrome d ubiquinol oxidase subunit II [Desulfovibrio sp.]MBI4959812.1 cytochrome d ubiquinol oxidase subunit II [Desulfovibrio sp.]
MDHGMLAEIWLWILAMVLAATVILDGFDLGVGILCLIEKDESKRQSMVASIEGVWHANQTWLVVAGGVLFGAFPRAYGMLLSSLYIPSGILLLGLMARGVGLEYYEQSESKRAWSTLFGLGSLVVALAQGAMLGAVMQGLPMAGHQQFLTPFAWVTPGAFLGAMAMVCVVATLGAGWLAATVQDFGLRKAAILFSLAGLLFQAGLAICVPATGIVALAFGAVSAAYLAWAVTAMASGAVFFLPACLHVLFGLVAWLIALRPGFVEPGLTPLNASAAFGSLKIMLWGFGLTLPVIIGYTIYQYRVFMGQGAYSPGHDH